MSGRVYPAACHRRRSVRYTPGKAVGIQRYAGRRCVGEGAADLFAAKTADGSQNEYHVDARVGRAFTMSVSRRVSVTRIVVLEMNQI